MMPSDIMGWFEISSAPWKWIRDELGVIWKPLMSSIQHFNFNIFPKYFDIFTYIIHNNGFLSSPNRDLTGDQPTFVSSSVGLVGPAWVKDLGNLSRMFLFLQNCEFFLLEVIEKTLTKKPEQCMHFQFSIKKMKIKIKINSKIDA